MKVLAFTRCTFAFCAAAAMLVACGGSQFSNAAPNATPNNDTATGPERISDLHGALAPDAALTGIYASEYQDSGPSIFGYPTDNLRNRRPFCKKSVSDVFGVAVDGKGNFIAPGFYHAISVFRGPDMCGPKVGEFHAISGDDGAVDAASADAINGVTAIAIYQDAGTGYGSLQLCTLKRNCTTNLTNGYAMNEVLAVAMREGQCWASSAAPTALTYFKGCAEPGQTATGYANESAGGLDIDKYGDIVAISASSSQVYVYSGCRPACKVVGGPFTLLGTSFYGRLNGNSTRLAVADYQYGQIDIYKYEPKAITYLYSFNRGLSASREVYGVAYNPRSI